MFNILSEEYQFTYKNKAYKLKFDKKSYVLRKLDQHTSKWLNVTNRLDPKEKADVLTAFALNNHSAAVRYGLIQVTG